MRDRLAPGCISIDTASLGGGEPAPLAPASITKSIGEPIFAGTLLGGWAGGMYPNWWSQSFKIEQVQHFKFWVQIALTCKMREAAAHFPNIAIVNRDTSPKAGNTLHRQVRYQKSLNSIKPHEEIEHVPWDHPLVQLFEHPNKWDTAGRLWSRLIMYMDLTGNGYLWVVPNRLGRPVEIWVIPSQWVLGPRLTKDGIWYYEVRPLVNGQPIKLPPEEIVHFQYDNPHTPIDGWAPLQGGAEWVDVQESINRRRFWMMKNVMATTGAIEIGADFYDPDNQDLDRIATKLAEKYQGEHRDSLPMILPPGSKYTPLKITPLEMDFIQSHDQMRDATLALFGVPKEIATIQDAGSEIAMYGPMQLFCRFTMGSWYRSVGEVLTKEIGRRFDERMRIWWSDSSPDNPAQVNADLQLDMANGIRTINEARGIRGLEPYEIPEADKPLVNPQLVPLGEGGDLFGGMDGGGEGGMSGKGPPAGPEENGQGAGDKVEGDKNSTPAPQSDDDLHEAGKAFVADLLDGWDPDTADIEKWCGATSIKGFGDCPRDAHGHCKPQNSGDETGKGGAGKAGATPATGHAGSPELHAEATSRARKLVGLVSKLPGRVWDSARKRVAEKYESLSARYGKPVATAVLAAGILGMTTPVPGGGLLAAAPILGVAELYLRLRGEKVKRVRPRRKASSSSCHEEEHPWADDGKVRRPRRKNYDPQEPRDDHGRWTEGGSGKKPEEGGASNRDREGRTGGTIAAEMGRRAAAVQFADAVVPDPEGATDVSRHDYDAIEASMSDEERREMESFLEDARETNISDAMRDFDTDVDEQEVAEEAGYGQRDIRNRVRELVEEHTEYQEDEQGLLDVLDGWYQDTLKADGSGERGIEGVIDAFGNLPEGVDFPEPLREALEEYKDRAADEIRQAVEAAEEKQAERREELEADYDDSDDRANYLRQFYDDHEDRYVGGFEALEPETWYNADNGEWWYKFGTEAGGEYRINVFDKQAFGIEAQEVQFKDAEGSFKVTGAGGAHEVFGKVVPAIVAYVQKRSPQVLVFSAAEESRRKLYDRLVKSVARLSPEYTGLSMEFGEQASARWYTLVRRDQADGVRAKIEAAGATAGKPAKVSTLAKRLDAAWFTRKAWGGIASKTWDESSHPRANDGRFGSKPGEHEGHGDSGTPGTSGATPPLPEKPRKGRPVPAEKLASYRQDLTAVLDCLPAGAGARLHKLIRNRQGGVVFYPDGKALTRAFWRGVPDELLQPDQKRNPVLGFADPFRGTVHLDGPGDADQHTQQGVYAHEIGHLLDRTAGGEAVSRQSAWQDAWQKEIVVLGRISAYARSDPAEGYAEFWRMLHFFNDRPDGRRTVAQAFPRCVAVLEEHGLWD